MDASEYFRAIGDQLTKTWDTGGDLGDRFPSVASETLREIAPPNVFGFSAVMEWALSRYDLPRQVNFYSGFGDPPLVVYADDEDRFYIELLVWSPSRTAIHGHGFSGAFRVLSGYSVQCRYSFEGVEISEGVKEGELTPIGLDFIAPGHVNAIERDEDFIHTVIHMGRPSLTLVVRTPTDKSVGHQYEYYRAGLAVASFMRSQSLTRQQDLLHSLRGYQPEALEAALLRFLESGDLHRLARCTLGSLRGELNSEPELRSRVREWGIDRFGDPAERIFKAAEECNRTDVLWRLLREQDRPELELVTSLREILPSEESLHHLLRRSDPESEPRDTLKRWETESRKAVI